MSKIINSERNFITIYTDASVRPRIKRTQVAWQGRCSYGLVRGTKVLDYDPCIERAEMHAFYYAIDDAVTKFPEVSGFFINSDNLQCVQSFWTFRNMKPSKKLEQIYKNIQLLVDGRWIRTKHVKAHTGGQDIRSYMNRTVDRLTRLG